MTDAGSDDTPSALVEHFFRHECGRLTATLTRRFGAARLEAIEDAIQHALERALGTWSRRGVPEAPAAWLTRVATNRLLDQLRAQQRSPSDEFTDTLAAPGPAAGQDAGEDTLVMLFACADPRLAPRARLVLCLKLLCGFSTEEIATRLFITPANVQKTLERGRQRLKLCWQDVGHVPRSTDRLEQRLPTVQQVLYLQFNEGYSLGPGNLGLRAELCSEAIRLTSVLVQHPLGDRPTNWALLALMHLHSVRLPARLDDEGQFVPLQEQDRSRWDRHQLSLGMHCLQLAGRGEEFSRYHGEAAIQWEHAMASDFASTRWHEIESLYATLNAAYPSPLYTLNRAIALAEASGPAAALDTLHQAELPAWFKQHHLYHGALGELHRRLGDWTEARHHLQNALAAAPSEAERKLFERRLKACSEG